MDEKTIFEPHTKLWLMASLLSFTVVILQHSPLQSKMAWDLYGLSEFWSLSKFSS